jgi:hypothetical protein
VIIYIEELEGIPGHLGLLLLLPLVQNVMLIDTQPIIMVGSPSRVEWQ